MSTIVISPSNVVTFPEGGGHFWVYMQYVQGFLSHGCEIYWLERFVSSSDRDRDAYLLKQFRERMERFGLKGKAILYTLEGSTAPSKPAFRFLDATEAEAESLFQRADLLLNFYYAIHPVLLQRFKQTALVDIDPGLLQFWISSGQLTVPPHDYYLTTGETVGTPSAKFPDCGLPWIHIQPPVSLECWPYSFDPNCQVFSTISTWWAEEWITEGKKVLYENNKRITFLQFVNLPRLTTQRLELALNFGESQLEDPWRRDAEKILLSHGWRLRHSYKVARSPESYRSYIQSARGEFSCVKPSCLKLQNAWVSDRSVCYLASGKPIVVQDTGPSKFLPNGTGIFKFSTMEEAVDAFSVINSNYEKHCRAAREIAAAYFDAKNITAKILNYCQSLRPSQSPSSRTGAASPRLAR